MYPTLESVNIVQVWNPEEPQEEVLVMIVRTGFNTVMGAMVRELVSPTKVFIQKTPFTAVSPASTHCCLSVGTELHLQRHAGASEVWTAEIVPCACLIPYTPCSQSASQVMLYTCTCPSMSTLSADIVSLIGSDVLCCNSHPDVRIPGLA